MVIGQKSRVKKRFMLVSCLNEAAVACFYSLSKAYAFSFQIVSYDAGDDMHAVKSIGLYAGWGSSFNTRVYTPGGNNVDVVKPLADELASKYPQK